MAIINVELEDKYYPKTATENITVSAAFGNGQPGGGYVIFLDQKLKGVNNVASMGNAAQVSNKWTIVSATIIDKLDETNWTSVTITFTEGDSKTVYGPYSKQVPKHLDTVNYLIKILNVCN